MSEYKHVVGIDLGTTNTLACYTRKGKPEFVKFPGGKILPSVLYVDENDVIFVGQKAVSRGNLDPRNQIRSSKTDIGIFKDGGRYEKPWNCHGKTFNPTQVATEILKEVRRCFAKREHIADDEPIGAVITVPAYFNSNQTDETRKAGEAAGFQVMQIVTEPMAAAVEAVRDIGGNKRVLVVDLGGGTFDLSVLEAKQDEGRYKAIAIGGDQKLGGDDFDEALAAYFLSIIEEDTDMDLSSAHAAGMEAAEYYRAKARILEAATEAKCELSDMEETQIDIGNLLAPGGRDYSFSIKLSRQEFDEICQPLYDKIIERINKFVKDGAESGKFMAAEIEEVILAGGSSRIPYIQDAVSRVFGKVAKAELDPSTLVVYGAWHIAVASSGLASEGNIHIEDILSHSLGLEILNDQGKLILQKMLEKDTVYPSQRTEPFTTTYDNQEAIEINIYEAGSDCEDEAGIEHHDFYGSMILEGIERAPKGTPCIDVTFSYDKSRCLTVTATDRKTQASRTLQIKKGEKAVSQNRERPIDFMLLIDASGSMKGQELIEAKAAASALVEDMIDFSIHRIGVIKFNDVSELLSPLTDNRANMLQEKINNIVAQMGTNMVGALHKAYDELEKSSNDRVIIIVTDGSPDRRTQTVNYAKELKEKGIRIIGIGAGAGVNEECLKQIASENDFYKLDTMSELRDTFERVIQRITTRK